MSKPTIRVQAHTGFGSGQIAETFSCVQAHETSQLGTSFSAVTLRSLQHPGVVLCELDGIGVLSLSAPKHMTMLLGFAVRPQPADPRRRGLMAAAYKDLDPALCLDCDEQTAHDLAPLYAQLAARLVELRQHGWRLQITEKVRVHGDWNFTTELINPLDDTVAVTLPLRIKHGRKAIRRLQQLLRSLQQLPTTPQVQGAGSSQQVRLERMQELAAGPLAQLAADASLKVALSAALTAHPDLTIDEVVDLVINPPATPVVERYRTISD